MRGSLLAQAGFGVIAQAESEVRGSLRAQAEVHVMVQAESDVIAPAESEVRGSLRAQADVHVMAQSDYLRVGWPMTSIPENDAIKIWWGVADWNFVLGGISQKTLGMSILSISWRDAPVHMQAHVVL